MRKPVKSFLRANGSGNNKHTLFYWNNFLIINAMQISYVESAKKQQQRKTPVWYHLLHVS